MHDLPARLGNVVCTYVTSGFDDRKLRLFWVERPDLRKIEEPFSIGFRIAG